MINGKTFTDLGYEGKQVGECLEVFKRLDENSDVLNPPSEEELISAITGIVGPPFVKLKKGEQQHVACALTPQNDAEEEHKNVCLKGLKELTAIPVVESAAMMPDACVSSSGEAAICVGGVVKVKNAIIPSCHSADLVCSMTLSFFESDKDIKELLQILKSTTRFGQGGREKPDWVYHPELNDLISLFDNNQFLKGLDYKARSHMSTQGASNHFASLGEITITEELSYNIRTGDGVISNGRRLRNFIGQKLYCLVTHHGSRAFGAEVYKRGLKAAIRETNKIVEKIPNNAAWLDVNTDIGAKYWEALQIVEKWTKLNHESIHENFLNNIESHGICRIFNAHNFVFKRGDYFYHGKGATPAEVGQIGIIPMNMGAPIYIVSGLGNEKYLSFCPHGSGRHQSRNNLLRENGVTDENEDDLVKEQIKGLEIIWYDSPDYSETPSAYKNHNWIKQEIQKYNLAEIIGEIQPLGCIMNGKSSEIPFWKQKKIDRQK
jgi:hypothetical protein